MGLDRHDGGKRRLKKSGAHRKQRKSRRVLTRTFAAGGAALAIGAAGTPTAEAFSILIPGPEVDGAGSMTRINFLEGNIFNPQFGIGGSASNNNVIGNIAIGIANDIVNSFLSHEFNLGGAATLAANNVTQINILSYNIVNPQFSIGPNVSNNSTISNVAAGNGNGNTTAVGGSMPLFGGAVGNGNSIQVSLFSGNIFNPQYSMAGNTSNNTAVTNVAVGNGNDSATTTVGSLFGGFMRGNGNTLQLGFFVSNIFNPQYALGGGNVSNNSATTNTATNNGNNSTNEVTGGGLGTVVVGTTGNGQTTQVASGSGNIFNNQVNVGPSPNSPAPVVPQPQPIVAPPAAGSNDTDIDISAMSRLESDSTDTVPSSAGLVDANSGGGGLDENPAASGLAGAAPPNDPAGDSPTDNGAGSQPSGDGGGTGDGSGGGGDGGA